MRATDLIKKLQEAIEAEGDGTVGVIIDPECRERRIVGIEVTKIRSWRPTDRNYAIMIEARSGLKQ